MHGQQNIKFCNAQRAKQTHQDTYLRTPWCRVLLEKLTGLQLVKKFPAFHEPRRFITARTSVRYLSLSWASPIQSIYHLLEIHPNIIQPSTPRSPQWSPSLRFPHQDPIHPLSSPYAPHAQPNSFFSILSPAQYWVRSTSLLAPPLHRYLVPPYLLTYSMVQSPS